MVYKTDRFIGLFGKVAADKHVHELSHSHESRQTTKTRRSVTDETGWPEPRSGPQQKTPERVAFATVRSSVRLPGSKFPTSWTAPLLGAEESSHGLENHIAPQNREAYRSTHNGARIFYPPQGIREIKETTMNPAMQMPMMGMPMMGSMMPQGMQMGMPMGTMMPGMPMMGGMMPMPMMMCKMTCKMTATGMVCEMMPMEGMSQDMFMEYCKRMMGMMQGGMPMMMACGGMMMMG
jgi:hypothetical protein